MLIKGMIVAAVIGALIGAAAVIIVTQLITR